MPVAAMLACAVHQPLDLALGETAPFDCQVFDGWSAFSGPRFHRNKALILEAYWFFLEQFNQQLVTCANISKPAAWTCTSTSKPSTRRSRWAARGTRTAGGAAGDRLSRYFCANRHFPRSVSEGIGRFWVR